MTRTPSPRQFADIIAGYLDGEADTLTGARVRARVLDIETPVLVMAEYDPEDAATSYYRITVERIEL